MIKVKCFNVTFYFFGISLILHSFFLQVDSAGASDFYASSTAQSSGTGTLANPWQLNVALQKPLHGGDTLWLRGGTYSGTFFSTLTGNASAPVVVRQYLQERAVLDGGPNTNPTLNISGSYSWFWGLEIMSSDTDRVSVQATSWPTDLTRGPAIATNNNGVDTPGIKLINLVIHDSYGSGLWKEALDLEMYGCIIFNEGWNAPDRGHGHGIYVQNRNIATKTFVENVIFNNFSHYNFHMYGSAAAFLSNITAERNVLVNGVNLFGGGKKFENLTLTSNHMYGNDGLETQLDIGYQIWGAGSVNSIVKNNFFLMMNSALAPPVENASIEGNLFQGRINFTASSYPQNTYLVANWPTVPPKPTINSVFIYPNKYESDRALVVVHNWQHLNSVNINVPLSLFAEGASYELKNALNIVNEQRLGTFSGQTLSIPMTGWTLPKPIGYDTLLGPSPYPEFGVFVLKRTSGAQPTPTATPNNRTPSAPTNLRVIQ